MLSNYRINKFLNKADKLFYNKKYDEALISYDNVLNIDSLNINALLGKSKIFFEQKKFSEALVLLDEVLKIQNNEDALLLKGRIYIESNELEKGLAFYVKYVNSNFSFDKYFKEVSYYSYLVFDEDKLEIALQLCDLYLEQKESYKLSAWKCEILLILNEFEECLSNLNILLDINPNDNALNIIKVASLLGLRKFDQLLIIANKLLENDFSYLAIYYKAEALVGLGEYEESLDFCNMILSSDEEELYDSAKFVRAKVYNYSKKYEFALDEVNILIESTNNYKSSSDFEKKCFYQYNWLKSLILYNMRMFDESKKIVDCLIENDYIVLEVLYLKSKLLLRDNDKNNALKYIDKVLEFSPKCDKAIELKNKIEN